MKLLETNNTEKDKILEILINLSGFDLFQVNLLELNALFRISFLLFETVKKENEEKSKQTEQDLTESLELLLLTNKTETASNIEVKSSMYILYYFM